MQADRILQSKMDVHLAKIIQSVMQKYVKSIIEIDL